MTTDFRALCKELTDALAEWELGGSPPEDTADADLIARARAALAKPVSLEDRIAAADAAIEASMERIRAIAAPARAALAAEPEPPVNGEVAGLVAWLRGQDGGISRRATYSRIADLLSRQTPEAVPEGPDPSPVVARVRDLQDRIRDGSLLLAEALEELGVPANSLPLPSQKVERLAPQPEPEGPADDDIEALHQAVFASRLYGSPPSTTLEVDFARAVLARWGNAPNA